MRRSVGTWRAVFRPRLMLPASGAREDAWKYALDKINNLRP